MLKMMTSNRIALLGCLAFACGGSQAASDSAKKTRVQVTKAEFLPSGGDSDRASAVAQLRRTGPRNKPAGKLTLEQEGDRVRLSGEFRNLRPGTRGIQIRENGTCAGRYARQAGDHFNPTDTRHGPPESSNRHVGDLGNVAVNKRGEAQFELITNSLTVIEDGNSSVLDRAVVITTREDDGSHPGGNAGPAIACGVIREA